MNTPISDFVRAYAQADISRLHMPGHKGHGPLGCEALDITEISGADELYGAEGIIAESEANATKLFGTVRTFYSTEGSSQCIRAMLFLALQAAPGRGHRPVLLAARNAHKALLYAAALLDFDVEWLWPAAEDAALCRCPVEAAELAAALERLQKEGRAPFGVYVTSPDYLGTMQDIGALAAVCREKNVPLLVDNAHGAYLRFLPEGSRHPIDLGAAMCCDSGHKTLPVLTGGAYLHLGKNAPVTDEAAVRGALALFGSTSPSYLILQSLDLCNAALAGAYPERLARCVENVAQLRTELNRAAARPFALEGKAQEPLKLTLDAAILGDTGWQLAELFRTGGVECEYADPRYLVLMAAPGNSPRDFARIRAAAFTAVQNAPREVSDPESEAEAFAALKAQAKQRCTIRQAVFAAQERISSAQAEGRVCALPTVSCPPAVPIAVSGEEIGPAAQMLMKKYGIKEVAVIKNCGYPFASANLPLRREHLISQPSADSFPYGEAFWS